MMRLSFLVCMSLPPPGRSSPLAASTSSMGLAAKAQSPKVGGTPSFSFAAILVEGAAVVMLCEYP
jgi:hypothetical protein